MRDHQRRDKHDNNEDAMLYVILPYFNYCHYQTRKELFLEFVERIKNNPKIRIIIAEVAYEGESFQLPYKIPGTYMHLGFYTEDRIWLKENIINLAIDRIPDKWKYMAWIDADIAFLNQTWADDTIKALQRNDVVQMFRRCINMGPRGEALRIDRSFAFMISDGSYLPTHKYCVSHPGYAWAMTRKAYKQMGGLVDWAILGSGDRHMAMALVGDVQHSHPGNISRDYEKRCQDYQDRCDGLRLGYVDMNIMHYWHGSLKDRKYQERWAIITDGIYMPKLDIEKNKCGLVQLTKRGKRLAPMIHEYFVGRNEDAKK